MWRHHQSHPTSLEKIDVDNDVGLRSEVVEDAVDAKRKALRRSLRQKCGVHAASGVLIAKDAFQNGQRTGGVALTVVDVAEIPNRREGTGQRVLQQYLPLTLRL